jgi:DNA-directed RNA polymerase specialized sigma24 family protein
MNAHDPLGIPFLSSSESPSVRLEAAREVLEKLPVEQREVIVLLGFYRMTRDEISALLGQPLTRIDGLFRAAVRSLRGILGTPSHQHPTFA